MRWVLACALLLAFGLPLHASAARADTLVVFAAASLKNAFDEIGAAFTAQTDVDVVFSYAGTSALARQIEQGAPADVFASANAAWTTYLVERDALDEGSITDFAGNALVVASPAGSQRLLEVTDIDSWLAHLGEDGRIAVALTNAVPAGIYARQALESLGLWQTLQPRLAQSDNVRSAMFLVARGEAPLGFVYATDALADPSVAVVAEIPQTLHTPILYTASRVAGAGSPAADQFLAFLMQGQTQGILQEQGFTTVRQDGT